MAFERYLNGLTGWRRRWRRPWAFTGAMGLCAWLLAAGPASAQIYTWNVNANGNWTTNSNWSPGTGNPNGAGQTARFLNVITADRVITLNSNRTVGHLLFDDDNNYTIAGTSTLTFDNSNSGATLSVTNTNGNSSPTISANIDVRDNITIHTGTTGTLTLSGVISTSNSNKNFTKTGTGTLVLSNSGNTFAGPIAVQAGTLRLEATGATGATTYGNSVSSGATLELSGGITNTEGSWSIAGTGSTGSNGALSSVSGSNTLNATLNLDADSLVVSQSGSTLNVTGQVGGGAHVLTLDGAGAMNFTQNVGNVSSLIIQGTGSKTFTGSQINTTGASSIVVNGPGSHTITSVINASTYTQNGGTVTLNGSGSNNLSTGATVNDGTLILNKSSGHAVTRLTVGDGANTALVRLDGDNQIQDWNVVTINKGSTLDLNNHSDSIGTLVMTAGEITTGTGTLTLQQGGSNVVQTYASTDSSIISGKLHLGGYQPHFNVADGAADDDLLVSAVISGSNGFAKDGTGRMTLTANNSFNGNVALNGGILSISNNNQLGNSSNDVDFDGGTLEVTSSFSLGAARDLTMNSGGGTIRVTTGNTFSLNNNGQLNGSGTATKTGGGILEIGGTTTVNRINIQEGTLLMGGNNKIGDSTNITMSGGKLDTDGHDDTMGTLTLTGNSTLDLGSGSSVIKFASSSSESWSGTLSILNWSGSDTGGGSDQVWFGASDSGLTAGQLSQIYFINPDGYDAGTYTAQYVDGTGEIIPYLKVVPEAETWAAAAGLLGLGLGGQWWRKRRLYQIRHSDS